MRRCTSGHINLLKTMLGSGILSFPYLFSIYGVAASVAFSAVFAFLSIVGMYALSACSQRTGRNSNLSLLTMESVPSMRFFVDISVFTKCLGVSASYLIITRQLLTQILASVSGRYRNPNFALATLICCFGPISYFQKIENLRYTSLCGLAAIFFILVASVYRYISFGSAESKASLIKPYSYRWLSSIGKFVFAYTCHMNLFTVYNEMEESSMRKMQRLIVDVVLVAFVAYMMFGYFNCSMYGTDAHDNILENYPNDHLSLLVKLFYVMTMMFSYPLQINPCRLYFMNLIYTDPKKKQGYKISSFIITTALILTTTYVAVSGVRLGFIYSFVGSTSSTLMSLIFPAIFYMKMDIKRNMFVSFFLYVSFATGVFIFLVSAVVCFYTEDVQVH